MTRDGTGAAAPVELPYDEGLEASGVPFFGLRGRLLPSPLLPPVVSHPGVRRVDFSPDVADEQIPGGFEADAHFGFLY